MGWSVCTVQPPVEAFRCSQITPFLICRRTYHARRALPSVRSSLLGKDKNDVDSSTDIPRRAPLEQLGLAFATGALTAGFLLSAPAGTPLIPSAAGNTRLTTDETQTIRLFHKNTPSVVFITNLATRRDAFTLNQLEIPQGAGKFAPHFPVCCSRTIEADADGKKKYWKVSCFLLFSLVRVLY
jgi:hypothetical protein